MVLGYKLYFVCFSKRMLHRLLVSENYDHLLNMTLFCLMSILELMFLETSALTGENVEEAFVQCARKILNKIESGKSLSISQLFFCIFYTLAQ